MSPSDEEIDALAELFERADLVMLEKAVKGEVQKIGLAMDMRQLIADALRFWVQTKKLGIG